MTLSVVLREISESTDLTQVIQRTKMKKQNTFHCSISKNQRLIKNITIPTLVEVQ